MTPLNADSFANSLFIFDQTFHYPETDGIYEIFHECDDPSANGSWPFYVVKLEQYDTQAHFEEVLKIKRLCFYLKSQNFFIYHESVVKDKQKAQAILYRGNKTFQAMKVQARSANEENYQFICNIFRKIVHLAKELNQSEQKEAAAQPNYVQQEVLQGEMKSKMAIQHTALTPATQCQTRLYLRMHLKDDKVRRVFFDQLGLSQLCQGQVEAIDLKNSLGLQVGQMTMTPYEQPTEIEAPVYNDFFYFKIAEQRVVLELIVHCGYIGVYFVKNTVGKATFCMEELSDSQLSDLKQDRLKLPEDCWLAAVYEDALRATKAPELFTVKSPKVMKYINKIKEEKNHPDYFKKQYEENDEHCIDRCLNHCVVV